jgi:hypothetical protein
MREARWARELPGTGGYRDKVLEGSSIPRAVVQGLVDLLVYGASLHFDDASGTVSQTDRSAEHNRDGN